MAKEIRRVCFDVPNIAEVDARDPWACLNLEKELPTQLGVFPIRIDVYDPVICVDIENPDVTVEQILDVFKTLGFHATLREEKV